METEAQVEEVVLDEGQRKHLKVIEGELAVAAAANQRAQGGVNMLISVLGLEGDWTLSVDTGTLRRRKE